MRIRLLLAAFVALAASFGDRPAAACATAVPPCNDCKDRAPVEIHREDALIVWNSEKKTEDFIRRAVFDTRVKSFGFIVPTPSRPTLSEAPASLFDELKDATKPEVIEKVDWDVIPLASYGCLTTFMRTKSASMEVAAAAVAPPPVTVLEETRVAGMDATVLAATDADALAKWLGAHGYDMRPSLAEWLKPYVAAGYTLTAFQYARPDVAANGPLGIGAPVAPTAVRISFPTERAYYPYREPSDAPVVVDRALHLFVLSDRRVAGALGGGAAWTPEVFFADRIKSGDALGRVLGAAPAGLFLTEMIDRAAKRAPDDVFLTGATGEAAATVRPPPIVRIVDRKTLFVPLDLIVLGALGVVLYRRRRARARQ
ncbi:MAG: DUF2330 domain-containing protein [Polyangiaceae bacterium]